MSHKVLYTISFSSQNFLMFHDWPKKLPRMKDGMYLPKAPLEIDCLSL